MINEEMQKAMEFIVQQQAKSSANIDALAEAQKNAEERWKRTDEKWERTEAGIRALLSIAEIHEREITMVTQGIRELSQEILNLGETTRNTDERLNTLINIVERQISEGRNGKP
ncbi:MAG: hypothetical protein M3Q91_15860 [Acidobacteriota bacterium]|nr:hypothetical protein [Acidobacteriota bacterium]